MILLTNDTFAADDREDAVADARNWRGHKDAPGVCRNCEGRTCWKCGWTGRAYVPKAAS